MAGWSERARGWVRRYLVAELTGLAVAIVTAVVVAYWSQFHMAAVAIAASLGETVGFYLGFLISQYRRGEIVGPLRQRIALTFSAAAVEFGPAEVADTFLVRPSLMFLGSLGTGNVLVGVLVGKIAADVVFYALSITSYELAVRRLVTRFNPASPDRIDGSPVPEGPSLIMDLDVVTEHYRGFAEALPGVAVHFAVKCNPDPPLLRHLLEQGARFEIASFPELRTLIDIGVEPADVIFSNPVKPWWHIRDAYAAGVRRFGADSDAELDKLARFAPKSGVLVRLAVPAAASDVPSEGKFGVDPDAAGRLLLSAVEAGLRPEGLAFHVGSQMTDPRAWTAPIWEAAQIMRDLQGSGVRLGTLDIGGGFPADYGQPVPAISEYGQCIAAALASLPYEVELVAEPGRGLVADAGCLESTVLGLAERGGQRWVHLDVGAFNGGVEALETAHRLVLPMTDSRGGPTAEWHVTGPSCDSQDTLRFGAPLSEALQVGDRVYLHTAGAYTTAYASAFNGFDVPSIRYRSAKTSSILDEGHPLLSAH